MPNKHRFLSKSRLTNQAEFNEVFASRKQMKSRCGMLRFSRNQLDIARLGLITSKRNVRFAVKRNLVRRIVRENFRLHQQALCGYDIVFVAYRGANEATRADLHKCLEQLLNTLIDRSR